MVALLLVTGYVNVALNSSLSSGATQTSATTSTANFYTNYKNEREATRTQEIQFYDSIIASATSSAEAKTEAELNKIIEETKAEIESEEMGTKSANYSLLKGRLTRANKVKADIAEGKKYGMKPDFYKYDSLQLKDPIY